MNSYEWLTKLVAFDTTSRNSNLSLIEAIKEWLIKHEIQSYLSYDNTKNKANLFATIPATNGDCIGGLLFSGHTDVVPVDGQQWKSDPFTVTQIENRLHGRGTCDMKGFIAVVLAAIPELQKLKFTHPLHLAFSYDEEVGCIGVSSLIADMQQRGIKPDACIVGEPTSMQPVVAHKGINVFRCQFHGYASHSSLTSQACNAIEYAAQLICWIRQLADDLRQQGPFDEFYDIPFSTISTNLIQGGTALNIIPALCEFSFELRNLATINPDTIINKINTYIQGELLPKMRGEYQNAAITIEPIAIAPGFETAGNPAFKKLMHDLTNSQKTLKVAYATEAGLFQRAGISTIICGPGNIEHAHRANEFVTIEQIKECEAFVRKIVASYLITS